MLRQHDPGIDIKRPLAAGTPHRLAQRIDLPDQQILATLQQIHGQKIRAARNPPAAIVRHIPPPVSSIGRMPDGAIRQSSAHYKAEYRGRKPGTNNRCCHSWRVAEPVHGSA